MFAFPLRRVGLLLVLCLCMVPELFAALQVGSGPTFSYSYSPRTRLALDTNAANVGVTFFHEPTVMNCSFISPLNTTGPASGTVTYVLLPDPGHVIEHVTLFQRGSLFNNGDVTGEYSIDGGNTFKPLFTTPPYPGTGITYTDGAALRNLMTSRLTLRYTIAWTNGDNFNVQFARDCDDNPFTLLMEGTIVPQAEADRWRVLVPSGSVWKYRDNGSNQGTDWQSPTFNDATWLSGPAELGYGDVDEATVNQFGGNPANKYITTYYRRAFQLATPASYDAFTLGLLRDDGAVVYLNGVEIFRSNLPGGTILSTTLATNAVNGIDEARFRDTAVPLNRFVPGTNHLAVEIHQNLPDSSDISFDLDLKGRLIRPRLNLARAGNCIVLSWDDPDFILERATDVAGPWLRSPIKPSSPVIYCSEGPGLFFRLSNP